MSVWLGHETLPPFVPQGSVPILVEKAIGASSASFLSIAASMVARRAPIAIAFNS